jgi:hypothetical protein
MALVVFSGLSGKDSLGDALLIRAPACPGRVGQTAGRIMPTKTFAWSELQIMCQLGALKK